MRRSRTAPVAATSPSTSPAFPMPGAHPPPGAGRPAHAGTGPLPRGLPPTPGKGLLTPSGPPTSRPPPGAAHASGVRASRRLPGPPPRRTRWAPCRVGSWGVGRSPLFRRRGPQRMLARSPRGTVDPLPGGGAGVRAGHPCSAGAAGRGVSVFGGADPAVWDRWVGAPSGRAAVGPAVAADSGCRPVFGGRPDPLPGGVPGVRAGHPCSAAVGPQRMLARSPRGTLGSGFEGHPCSGVRGGPLVRGLPARRAGRNGSPAFRRKAQWIGGTAAMFGDCRRGKRPVASGEWGNRPLTW